MIVYRKSLGKGETEMNQKNQVCGWTWEQFLQKMSWHFSDEACRVLWELLIEWYDTIIGEYNEIPFWSLRNEFVEEHWRELAYWYGLPKKKDAVISYLEQHAKILAIFPNGKILYKQC